MDNDDYVIHQVEMSDLPSLNSSFHSDFAHLNLTQDLRNYQIMQEAIDEANKKREQVQKAIERTAENTEQTNSQLQKIVQNQNEYIDILKQQLSMQRQQLEFDEQQLEVLKDIFASDQDGAIVEKEILKLIRDQINSRHPLWDYVKDKSGDVAVAGITAGVPIIFNALKALLKTRGIVL